MSDDWNDPERNEEEEADPGLIGGGSLGATMDDDDEELDEHGDSMQRADEDET